MRTSSGRFTVGRMMAAVAVSAAVLALLAAFEVPPVPGFAYGTIGCLALSGIIVRARDRRDLSSALAAFTGGLMVGVPLVQDSCSPVGLFFGPIAGIVVRILTRGRPRGRSGDPESALTSACR